LLILATESLHSIYLETVYQAPASMVDAGGTQPDACDASGTRPHKGREQQEGKGTTTADWQKHIDSLLSIKDDLEKEEERVPRAGIRQELEKAIKQARALWTQTTRGHNATEERLIRIESSLEKLTKTSLAQKNQIGQTWAKVAAQQATRTVPASVESQRTAIRIRLEGGKDKNASEILTEAKKAIPGAYAVRLLQSGDIDVIVPDQTTKDRVLNQPEVEGCKILRQDYLIEVPGVPLRLRVNSGKDADNSSLIREICEGTKRTIPGIAINRIRWLHDPEAQAKRAQAEGKTRGTLILGLPTQALQLKAVKCGIVIDSQLFETRLFDHSLQVKQCFKCSQWGHTQSACGRQEKCGQCAGPHATRTCLKERISCVNCGRPHRAWQRKECQTFQAYLEGIQAKRANLFAQSASVRNEGYTQATLQSDGFQIVQPRKRQRQETPTSSQIPQPRKGPGRPTYIDIAGRDPQQARIHIGSLNASASQATPTLIEDDMDIANPFEELLDE
jgi:hypothetical protein